jgi:hypothetical protein
MTQLTKLYTKLEKFYKKLITSKVEEAMPDDIDGFTDTANEIILVKDKYSLPILLKYFQDEGGLDNYETILGSLKKTVEYLDMEDYVKGLLQNLYLMFPQAKRWAMSLLYSILNDDNYLILFKNNLHLANKDQLLELFNLMDDGSEPHHSIINDLIKRLE